MSAVGGAAGSPLMAGEGRADACPLGGSGRRIQHDAGALAASVHDAADEVQRYLAAEVDQRPLRTLGLAAGVGFLVGGGLSSKVGGVFLGILTRVTTALVVRELGS
jgi:ElaB/YqjD/DUF883 family membrane-anchored ribosome-binding protein